MRQKAKFFRKAAWAQLKGNWKPAVILTLIYILMVGSLLLMGVKSNIISIAGMFVFTPLAYGYNAAFLGFKRTGVGVRIEELFEGFRDYLRVFGTLLLMGIYTYLWMLLLIVPGIIKAIAYSQTFYILRDNPELKFNAAINRSMAMMKGHKMEYFLLSLSFIGWILLSILTLNIGLLWVAPYMATAQAHFYDYVKEDYERRIAA